MEARVDQIEDQRELMGLMGLLRGVFKDLSLSLRFGSSFCIVRFNLNVAFFEIRVICLRVIDSVIGSEVLRDLTIGLMTTH